MYQVKEIKNEEEESIEEGVTSEETEAKEADTLPKEVQEAVAEEPFVNSIENFVTELATMLNDYIYAKDTEDAGTAIVVAPFAQLNERLQALVTKYGVDLNTL